MPDPKQRKQSSFFSGSLEEKDRLVFDAIQEERSRQADEICLIASENIVSQAVLEAQGSELTNKYAEGYPDKRYYSGCEFVDLIENIAIDRAKQVFGATYVNVQPHSGSQANQAVYFALLEAGDPCMGLSVTSGGHLTHGSHVSMSSSLFRPVLYDVSRDTNVLDMEELRSIALANRPKLIIAGFSGYPRIIDFESFRSIADEVGALLMVDMAHFAGLVAGGVYPNPVEYADVVTTTTHKTLRGPRGGAILTHKPEIAKKVNSAVFPGVQGGPLMHVIAAKAVAFGEALKPEFKEYAADVISNARALARALKERGLTLVSGGTDTHQLIIDLRPNKLTGVAVENLLQRSGLTCNKNVIPFDLEKPTVTSGVRLGAAAGTTRGFKELEFVKIGNIIADLIHGFVSCGGIPDQDMEIKMRKEVLELCARFPCFSF